ncbi:uncharacterized protein [Montipora capricornis]|uniref:uncharacterized protein n=1 Tax=Montipora capricornis TaxID=246305 RepID=UPI0035F1B084
MAAEPNFKGLLQIHCQRTKVALPQYTCVQRMKNNRAVFIANLTVSGQNFTSEAEFSSKKQAEKNAAKVALFKLGIFPADISNSSSDPSQCTSESELGEHKEGHACTEVSFVTAEQSHKDGSMVSASLQEGQGKQQCPSSEVERPLLSSVISNPVSIKNNAPLSYKNVLQERAQKMGLPLPHYETTKGNGGFVCAVLFNGQSFKSDKVSPNKKMAEQNAASVAIKTLPSGEQTHEEPLIPGNDAASRMSVTTPTCNSLDATISYKNLLQENCQQRGHRCPVYSTSWKEFGFVSVVHVGDKTASTKTPCESKKRAEQAAAREALLMLGVCNPEDVYKSKGENKNKLKRKYAPMSGFERRSWVHSHGGPGLAHSSQWSELDYYWEQAILSKRQKLDSSVSHGNIARNEEVRPFKLPQDHRRDFAVGEIWKEKKSIVIVGHEGASFILNCTRVPGTCNIFNTRTMSLVLLEPGCRIVGLDAQYCHHNGKVALQAERCADIIIPVNPDPVLTSCGVVLLFQDLQSGSLQVLLKRYLSSQAFVNVAAALAQYFRRRISGRHVSLDIESITEHISDWMSEEVQSIASMNSEALQHVFTYMWKFNKRWCSLLDHPLPRDLEVLKAKAADELARRQASDVNLPEDHYHPWSLPKGNFKHRMLSTGLFIETPADCAVRELKEETGIKLDADDIKNCAQIDLPQIDNLNPHKGDIVKYFLYVYSPDYIEDDLNASYDLEQINTSLEFETAQEEETGDKGQDELCYINYNTADTCDRSDVEAIKENTVTNMEASLASQSMQADQEESPYIQTHHTEVASNGKRGVKRKCTDDDKEKEEHDYKTDTVPLETKAQEEETGNKGQDELCYKAADTCDRSDIEAIKENTVTNMEASLASQSMQADQEESPYIQTHHTEVALNGKRGVKRKCTDDDKEKEEHDYKTDTVPLETKESHLPRPSEVSHDSASTPESKQEMISGRSPHVQGSVHEECAWFTIEEARVKSPVFQQIYETQQFNEFLNSLFISKGI